MPEGDIVEVGELKIHQASHTRSFEDLLKFVEYEPSMLEIMKTQVIDMVYGQIEDVFEEGTEEREQFDQTMEVWAASPKCEIMEHFTKEEVMGSYGTNFGTYPCNRIEAKSRPYFCEGITCEFLGKNSYCKS